MADEDGKAARTRLDELLAKTAKREATFGREAFLQMPSRLQNQLVVLQKQSEPKSDGMDAVVAAESNLREYNAKLDDAFNLKQQIVGERGRRSSARKRAATRAGIRIVVATVVIGGGLFLYRGAANEKAEECKTLSACENEGLCSAKLSFSPFGMQCAAQGDDCRSSDICSTQGMCSSREGICVAQAVEDCRRSKNCFEKGSCSPFAGTCVAGSGDDCKASQACHKHGACLEVGGRCVAPAGFGAPSVSASATASASASGKAPRLPKPRPRLRARP